MRDYIGQYYTDISRLDYSSTAVGICGYLSVKSCEGSFQVETISAEHLTRQHFDITVDFRQCCSCMKEYLHE